MGYLLTGGRAGSYAQLLTVLLVFALVLGVTAWVARWIAGYQKKQGAGCNIQVIETSRIANNKYLQIVRVGETYMVIAVCKDTVTMLGEVPRAQLKTGDKSSPLSFREIMDKAAKREKTFEETQESQKQDEQ